MSNIYLIIKHFLLNNKTLFLIKVLQSFACEIGNINRFNSYKSIIAFDGTDPKKKESGDDLGLHKHITKKGNKHLRTILYFMVNRLIKASNIDSFIKSFYKKKM